MSRRRLRGGTPHLSVVVSLRGTVALSGAALALACALPANAANWEYVPRVGLSAGYNSNVYLSPDDPLSNTLGIFDFSSAIQATTERSLARIDPAVHVYRNTDLQRLDRVDSGVNARINTKSERSAWDATFGYLHNTTLTSELGDTGVTYVKRYRDHFEGSFSPSFQVTERGSLIFAAQAQFNDYHNAITSGLLDYTYGTFTAGWAHSASERSQWALQVAGGAMDVPDSPASETSNAVASFRYRYSWSELTSISLTMGPSYAKSKIAEKWGGDGSLQWQTSNERHTWSMSLGRRFQPSGFGVLNNRDFVEASLGYRLTERWRSNTGLSFNRSTRAVPVNPIQLIYNPAAADDHYRVTYGALSQSLAWQITQTLSLGLSATGAFQQTNLTGNETGERFAATLGLVWQPRADL